MDRWKMELRKKKAKNAELTDDYKKFSVFQDILWA